MAHSRHVFYQKQKKAASKTAYDLFVISWSGRQDLNLRPLDPQGIPYMSVNEIVENHENSITRSNAIFRNNKRFLKITKWIESGLRSNLFVPLFIDPCPINN